MCYFLVEAVYWQIRVLRTEVGEADQRTARGPSNLQATERVASSHPWQSGETGRHRKSLRQLTIEIGFLYTNRVFLIQGEKERHTVIDISCGTRHNLLGQWNSWTQGNGKRMEQSQIYSAALECLNVEVLIVIGETGSGKTTQITQYMAEAGNITGVSLWRRFCFMCLTLARWKECLHNNTASAFTGWLVFVWGRVLIDLHF